MESYIELFIKNLVLAFRGYNKDAFILTILGIKEFISEGDEALFQLCKQLKHYDIDIKIEGGDNCIDYIDVTCDNLTKQSTSRIGYSLQSVTTLIELSSKTGMSIITLIVMNVVARVISKHKTLYKAIVLDLDDTLWKGTLAEEGINAIQNNMHSKEGQPFVCFMKFVECLAKELGLFVAICSKNDINEVKLAIDKLDYSVFPIKEQIDCVIANYNDKSTNIKIIAEQLSVLPKSIVFIDDNPIIRDEVRKAIPGLFVPEWDNHDDLITQIIVSGVFERNELSKNSQNRKKQFQIIQSERAGNKLPHLFVRVREDNNHKEAIRLYAKSNQFKISQFDNGFEEESVSLCFELFRENGDSLGICSALTYAKRDSGLLIQNWAISCRYFKIGLEEFVLKYMEKIAGHNRLFINYVASDLNKMVSELINKYSNVFAHTDKQEIELQLNDELRGNTNLILK